MVGTRRGRSSLTAMCIGHAGLHMRRPGRPRGVTLVELVATFAILAFVTLGTVQLYRVGDAQQRQARFYSDAQSANREAMRRMLRTIRHGFGVETAGSIAFNGASTNPVTGSDQIVVTVPQPNDSAGTGRDHIRFYLSGSSGNYTLYVQRSDDTNAGISLATGVQSLTFTYYKTTNSSTGASTSILNSGYSAATEVSIQLVTKSGGTVAGKSSTETGYVGLRNSNLGL